MARLLTGVGLAAVLLGLGIAVVVGAVSTPLTAKTAKTLKLPVALPILATLPASSGPTALSGSSASRPPIPASPTASASPRLSPTPSPSPSPSQELVPTPTREYQTPTGRNELAWSQAILRAFGDPLTSANIVSLGYWMQNEAGHPPWGIVGANNPINVSQPGYGGTPIHYEGRGYYLYSYPTVNDGISAIVAYLHRPSYVGILAALKAGAGLSSSSLAAEFLIYSGHGYSSVPDAWGASQGRPQS